MSEKFIEMQSKIKTIKDWIAVAEECETLKTLSDDLKANFIDYVLSRILDVLAKKIHEV